MSSWPADYKSKWDGNTNGWMSQIDGRVQLRDLSIPGTHDSASLYNYCLPISTTQYARIEEQLAAGIRFLDLRIKVDGNGLKMVHGSEDIGGYYDNSGRLSFKIVLEKIYGWMNENPNETVIIKVVDADYDDVDTEPDDYKTHTLVYKIWTSVDDASEIKRLEKNNRLSPKECLNLTLEKARGSLLLWRAFKYPYAAISPDDPLRHFGLDLYKLKAKALDNSPYYTISPPSGAIPGMTIPVLRGQSYYTWKESKTGYLSYSDKMNLILRLLYEAWCGHTAGVTTPTEDMFYLNEVNIAVSDGQPGTNIYAHYPITNATFMNPLVGYILEQMLIESSDLPTLTDKSAKSPGSVGILLFDWADNPTNATRDYAKTQIYNHGIYKRVIRMNFERSRIFQRDASGDAMIRYRPTTSDPYVVLQSENNNTWTDFNTNPTQY